MTAADYTGPRFTSVKGASQMLGMSIDDVYGLVKSGELKHVQLTPGGKIHILVADIDRWAEDAAVAKKVTA